MTIKKIIILVLVLLNYSLGVAQEKESGYFDSDNIEDTFEYKFVSDSINGPIYECKIIGGKGKKYSFNLGVGFEGISFFNCGKGCIETSQTKEGMMGFDVSEIYRYKKEYDNWILEKRETVYKEGKKEVYKPKVPIGIDGKKYKIEPKSDLNDFSGTYKLKSCQDSRFTIKITKRQKIYYYLIFDKEKTISKGKVILNKNNFNLGKIKGIFSNGNLKIENYDDVIPKSLHFMQCEEKYLTFLKKS